MNNTITLEVAKQTYDEAVAETDRAERLLHDTEKFAHDAGEFQQTVEVLAKNVQAAWERRRGAFWVYIQLLVNDTNS